MFNSEFIINNSFKEESIMNDIITLGLVAVAVLAVLGLGIRVSLRFKGGNKNVMKNINASGDVVGRDKVEK